VTSEEALYHPVPRLDAPDRLWLLPAPVAKWLAAGVFSGPVLAQLLAFFQGFAPADAWSLWYVWAAWCVGIVVGVLGAFWRPGGRHVGQWAGTLLDFVLVPRRAVWKPVGRGGMWW
jgi:hypothetical protein